MITLIVMSAFKGTLKERLEVLIWTLILDAMYIVPIYQMSSGH